MFATCSKVPSAVSSISLKRVIPHLMDRMQFSRVLSSMSLSNSNHIDDSPSPRITIQIDPQSQATPGRSNKSPVNSNHPVTSKKTMKKDRPLSPDDSSLSSLRNVNMRLTEAERSILKCRKDFRNLLNKCRIESLIYRQWLDIVQIINFVVVIAAGVLSLLGGGLILSRDDENDTDRVVSDQGAGVMAVIGGTFILAHKLLKIDEHCSNVKHAKKSYANLHSQYESQFCDNEPKMKSTVEELQIKYAHAKRSEVTVWFEGMFREKALAQIKKEAKEESKLNRELLDLQQEAGKKMRLQEELQMEKLEYDDLSDRLSYPSNMMP